MDLDVTECLRDVLPFGPDDAPWVPLVREILCGSDASSPARVRNITSGGRYGFGCVISKPGDGDQNWHQDGDTGRGPDEPTRTVIVFYAPVKVTRDQGPLEIIPRSHKVKVRPPRRAPFSLATFNEKNPKHSQLTRCLTTLDADLFNLTILTSRPYRTCTSQPVLRQGELPLALEEQHRSRAALMTSDEPGEVVIMDYRAWHRGRANASEQVRPLIYARYELVDDKAAMGRAKRGQDGDGDGRAKRRVAPTPV